jgi:hypothetical protein
LTLTNAFDNINCVYLKIRCLIKYSLNREGIVCP